MTLANKIKLVAGVLMVFFLILATNLIDKDNFAKVEESVETIYKDRLLTKDKVMELSEIVYEKEIYYVKNDSNYFVSHHESDKKRIDELISDCQEVINSDKEEKVLTELQENCDELYRLETDSANVADPAKAVLLEYIGTIHYNIDELAEVQIEEGRKQKLHSRSAMNSAKLFARIEIYLLVFLAVLVQFVILYKPKKFKPLEEDQN